MSFNLPVQNKKETKLIITIFTRKKGVFFPLLTTNRLFYSLGYHNEIAGYEYNVYIDFAQNEKGKRGETV